MHTATIEPAGTNTTLSKRVTLAAVIMWSGGFALWLLLASGMAPAGAGPAPQYQSCYQNPLKETTVHLKGMPILNAVPCSI
jgi:hypothetical protein